MHKNCSFCKGYLFDLEFVLSKWERNLCKLILGQVEEMEMELGHLGQQLELE